MALDDVAAVAADDEYDLAAELSAAFDEAEVAETPAADVPAEETAQETADRVRDDKGRFAPKVEAKADEPGTLEKVAAAEKPAAPIAAEPVVAEVAAEAVKPPPGFSPTAKVVWNKESLDKTEWEAVKRDIAKRNEEVDRGFAKFAEYKPIEKYVEMARNSGTSLDRALDAYISTENELKRDFPSGIARICNNMGIHPVALANQILARNGASPQQDGAGETQGHQQPGVDLSPITRELSELRSYVQQQQTATVQTELTRFASDPKHTFFENVKADMGRLINSGYAENLEDAYDKACWANQEIRSLLIKQQTPASDPSSKVAAATQARAAARSITGSPIPNASGKGTSISIEDEIRQLMDASV